ncbi:MAG: ABC transporter substrate-binding protein [Dehalococcoidia bacterium]
MPTAGGTSAAGSPAAATSAAASGPITRGVGAAVYDSIDPHRASGDPTLRLANLVQSHLIWYKNPDTGEVEPDVAASYEAPDAKTYIFKLRQGVKWQNKPTTNGREFVADDVKWHIDRQAQAKQKDGTAISDMRRQTFYKTITGIEVPDKYTIKLTLDNPSGTFIDRLAAFFSTIPNRETTEKYEADHRTLNEDAMVGTGPYIVTQWRPNKEVLLKRNPDYFRPGEPITDGAIWTQLFEDPNADRAAFQQKQLDGFAAADPTVTKAILEANKGQMYEVLAGVPNTVYLALNMNKQFKDIRLMQAVNMAFDRRALIQAFHQGLGQVSGPVTWLQEGYAIKPDELIKLNGYRTDRQAELKDARALWAAGGGPALGDVAIKVPRTWSSQWPDTSQILVKMLNENMGVSQFKSTSTDYNEEIIPNLANGNFPNWFGWTSTVSSADPREGLRSTFLSSSNANYNHVNNPALDKMLLDVLQIPDLKQAVAKTLDVQKILTDNAQYGNVVLYNYITRVAVWNYIGQTFGDGNGGGPLKALPSGGNPGTAYNLYAGHLTGKLTWINSKDPTYQGRPPANV